jgi:RHS repeat-associated protein
MLDSVGLVHMNGRVYDPTIGRFLSADPIIQTIQLSQAINPFSYVMNMPLMLTDPSGYSWFKKLFHSIGHFLKKFWRPILAIVVAVVSFGTLLPYCVAFAGSAIADGMIAGAIAGAVAGGITGGWKGALVGALSGAMFGGIAGGYGEAWTMGRVAENAVAGGISSEASGGKFKQGFILSGLLALSQYSYNKVMKYDVTWKKGDGLASTDGTYDEAFPVPKNPNVFGTNERLNPSGGGNFWKQGGWLSRHVDPIPGMHSLSRLHDYFQIRLGGISSFARNFGNVPAMIPATVINYASLLSTVPGYTAILDEN